MKRVIIIGSGLGGLSTGVILAKNGYHVTILEKESQVGGCLQCFKRGGVKFETGMHFIGSADRGQVLDKLLRYLEIKDKIQLSRLDPNGYDIISLDNEIFKFASGKEAFIEQMSSYFPKQTDEIKAYFNLVEQVTEASSFHSMKFAESSSVLNTEYQLRSINSVIDQLITDPLLAKVLVGNLPLYAPAYNKTPFSTHAFVTDFYNRSSFRIVGGSDIVSTQFSNVIMKYGGAIRTQSRVSKIICNDTKAIGVEINGSEFMEADIVISDIHPLRTVELLDTKLIRPAYRNRLKSMPQTVGVFSVYLQFKANSQPYLNSNFYEYNNGTPWNCEFYDEESWPKGLLYMHLCDQVNPKFATSGVILSYMQMSDVSKWMGTKIGHRGEDYETFKKVKAEKLIDSLEKLFPTIRENIQAYYTSTPLTYLDYTGTENGSMYGVAKDISLGISGRVPQRTKVPNVYQTGQNINSHGMLGVLVGSIVTCSELLTSKTIYEQIIESNYGV